MANYKLLTHESTGATSELMFTAGGTNTVVSSITAKDGSSQTAEVLVKKSGTSTVVEMAEVDLTSNAGFQIIDVAFALEAGDELYIRASRGGMKFIMSYVEETELPNDTALGGLLDVDTTGFTDGDSLVYSASNGSWGPAAVSGGGGGGASDLDGLSDVAITSSTSGDFLKHNGSNYVDVNFDSAVNANATVFANMQKQGYTTALFDADFATKDADDIDDASTTNHRFVTPQMQTNLGYLAPVTGNIDLDQHDTDIAANNLKVSYTDAAAVAANTLKVSADGSVATHSDVTDAGSGEIITDAERTKLNGIDTAATANDTDANLKDRANHTGTQLSSTISDFTVETESIIADVIGNTDDVSEGTTNLYHTSARVDARIGAADIADLNDVSSTAPSNGQVLKWNGSAWAPAADNSSTGGAGGVVDSVNGISQAAVVLDADNIDDAATTHKFTTAGDITKLAGIAFNATANDTDVNLKNRSNHTGQQLASTISDFGSASASVIVATNLQALANVDTPTTGEFLKWNGTTWETDTAGGGGAVDSVNTQTGVVVLDADDIDDSSTTHKFVSAADITKLGGIATGAEVNAVDSVNTQTGAVVLDADDIDDASTTHKFVAAGDVTKLGNITVANAVNLDTMNTLMLSNFTTANQAQSDITSHEGSLRNHSDIVYSEANPANIPTGSFLTWNGSTQWTDSLIDLQDLNNVDTPTTGEFLKWNGTTWETDTPTGGGGGGGTNVHDTDTTLTSLGDYDSGADIMDYDTVSASVTGGRVYSLSSSGWAAATSTGSSVNGLLAVCSSDATDGSSMILRGICKVDGLFSGASVGDKVYLGTGAKFTATAPTSAASVLICGRIIDATNKIIWFDPDKTVITIQ